MSDFTVGGGVSDVVMEDAGGLMTFRAAASMTLWDSAVGGAQYVSLTNLDGTTAGVEGGTFQTSEHGEIPPVVVAFPGETNPGGAWLECKAAWGSTRKWIQAHGAIVTGGGGGGGTPTTITVETIEVTDHVVIGGVWLADIGGVLSLSTDGGMTWAAVDSGGGSGGTVTLPDGLLRLVLASDGVTALPGDIGEGRILYVDPDPAATPPAWLRSSDDLFLKEITVVTA